MTNNEFDKGISDIVSKEIVPFNEANWVRMQQKLENNNKRIWIFTPFFYKSSVAAALIVLAIICFQKREEKIISKTPSEDHQVTISKRNNHTTVHKAVITSAKAVDTKVIENIKQDTALAYLPSKGKLTDSIIPAEPIVSKERPIITLAKDATNKTLPTRSVFVAENIDNAEKQRKIIFSINSGVTVFPSNNSFTAGITVKSKLTEKIFLHTGLGFVQGQQHVAVKYVDITETPIIVPSDTGQTTVIQRIVTERTEEYSRNLPYIQFNPGISIQIIKRLHGVIGLDIQRIVINSSTLDDINKHLATINRKIPETDAGITLNMSCLITRNIGIGLSYRASFAGRAKNNIEYVKRNYSQIQLQYTFNKKK